MSTDNSSHLPASVPADDSLPPVQPPNVGFLLQLFVIPGVIVSIIVVVYLSFNWLAHMGRDPHAIVDDIRRDNAGSWQAASDLANELRRDPQLRKNADLAADLAGLLEQHLNSGAPPNDNEMDLRAFLCRALGEFQVAEGQPALIQAATTQRDERDETVRRAALESLAVRIDNMRQAKAEPAGDLLPVLLEASRDESALIRSTSAFTLGVMGGEQATERLERMLSDSWPDVRYNAATGLARRGNALAIPVLVEMLDPQESAGVGTEKQVAARDFKRASILMNALRACEQLAEANSSADLKPVKQAVEKLVREGKLEAPLRVEAKKILLALDERKTGAQQ